MAEEGKIDGKYPIFNDILCFLWCKMKLCPRDTLLNILQQFYKAEDITKARDVLFVKIPAEEGETRRKHRKVDEILGGMYTILQNLPSDDPPIFASINLNNIPWVEMKSVDGAALMYQQGQMKDQLSTIVDDQAAMKTQIALLIEAVEKITPHHDASSTNTPSFKAITNKEARVDKNKNKNGNGKDAKSSQSSSQATRTQPTEPPLAPREDASVRPRDTWQPPPQRTNFYRREGYTMGEDGFFTRTPRSPKPARRAAPMQSRVVQKTLTSQNLIKTDGRISPLTP